MFSNERSATASYRALARGRGADWLRAYRVSQRIHDGTARPGACSAGGQRLEMPMSAPTMPAATSTRPTSATTH